MKAFHIFWDILMRCKRGPELMKGKKCGSILFPDAGEDQGFVVDSAFSTEFYIHTIYNLYQLHKRLKTFKHCVYLQ